VITKLDITFSNIMANPLLADALDTTGVQISDSFEDCNVLTYMKGSLEHSSATLLDLTTAFDQFKNGWIYDYVRLVIVRALSGDQPLIVMDGWIGYIRCELYPPGELVIRRPKTNPLLTSLIGGIVLQTNTLSGIVKPVEYEIIVVGKGEME